MQDALIDNRGKQNARGRMILCKAPGLERDVLNGFTISLTLYNWQPLDRFITSLEMQ